MPASSSRRSAVKALFALAVAGGATALLRSRRGGQGASASAASRGPRLAILVGPSAPLTDAELPTGKSLWVVLASLDGALRSELADELPTLLDALEARAMPLGDLLEVDVEAIVTELTAKLLPLLNAANGLVAPRYRAADDSLSVRVVSATDVSSEASARVVDAWQRSDGDRAAEQARFLAWPVSSAVSLRCFTPEDARSAAESLRKSAAAASSSIALVVDEDVQRAIEPPALARLREAAARGRRFAAKRPDHPLSRLLKQLEWVPSQGSVLLPWLSLDDRELFVVPRMGALARRGEFLDEVTRACPKRFERVDNE